MFCGIVEEMGTIRSIELRGSEGICFEIEASVIAEDLKIGDSVGVNGCCLTVTSFSGKKWRCHAVPETLHRTNLKDLQLGDPVNLERALRYRDRVGGHLIQGHIDETGKILVKEKLSDGSWTVIVQASPDFLRYAVFKGSIAVDGVSLTIAGIDNDRFTFAMIPHTASVTTLGFKEAGQAVNLEADLTAKYIERLFPGYDVSRTNLKTTT